MSFRCIKDMINFITFRRREPLVHLYLVAKYPIPGKTKTRLAKHLGDENATRIAHSFLADLISRFSSLTTVSYVQIEKFILFAPEEKKQEMMDFVARESLNCSWNAKPMINSNLVTSNLGDKLSAAVSDSNSACWGPVVFIGMDTPHLPSAEIEIAIKISLDGDAYISPAEDGGYVLLSIPSRAPPAVFNHVQWSVGNTCSSQIQRLQMYGINTVIGNTYFDVDTITDLKKLIQLNSKDQKLATLIPKSNEMLQRLENAM